MKLSSKLYLAALAVVIALPSNAFSIAEYNDDLVAIDTQSPHLRGLLFASQDGEFVFEFGANDLNVVTLTIGNRTETVTYRTNKSEVTFDESTFIHTRISWILSSDGTTLASADNRIKLYLQG